SAWLPGLRNGAPVDEVDAGPEEGDDFTLPDRVGDVLVMELVRCFHAAVPLSLVIPATRRRTCRLPLDRGFCLLSRPPGLRACAMPNAWTCVTRRPPRRTIPLLDASLTSVAVVAAVAVLAPLALALTGIRLPAIVLEILLGIVVGPQVLGWAHLDEP